MYAYFRRPLVLGELGHAQLSRGVPSPRVQRHEAVEGRSLK